ncbi:hypothetical protein GF351_03955 [Candidatus Woesearchaeota archaeon]|nr:hypothetical protein [Candidatus Woesearchaeota archaeon]
MDHNSSKRGILIAIEGNDSCGKATQQELLLSRLKKNNYRTADFSIPQYDKFWGKLIGRYLSGEFGKIDDISPYLVCLPFAMDMLSLKGRIMEWLEQGRVIVADRYIQSNIAYTAAKKKGEERKEIIEWLNQMYYEENNMPQEDMILHLDMPLSICQDLLMKKANRRYLKGTKKDIHERNLPYLKEVDKVYQLLKKKGKWETIRCTCDGKLLSKQDISDEIWNVVKKFLADRGLQD